MKPQTMTGNHRSRPFLLIALSLLIVVPLCSGACVTSSVMDYAKIKASPSNVTEFTIGKVYSASVLENGDLSILAELDNPNHPKSGLYTMTVPLPCLVENTDGIESYGFRAKYTPSASGLPSYLYPMGKAKKISGDRVQKKDSPNSSIHIEELSLHPDEADRLPELLGDLNRDPSAAEKIYVINLLPEASGKTLQEDPSKGVPENPIVEKSILLVYWPPLTAGRLPKPITIAGAYEDESTNLYYLLVPPAIAFDSFLIALAIAVQGASSGYLSMY
jgi:hypothetical protein